MVIIFQVIIFILEATNHNFDFLIVELVDFFCLLELLLQLVDLLLRLQNLGVEASFPDQLLLLKRYLLVFFLEDFFYYEFSIANSADVAHRCILALREPSLLVPAPTAILE